MLPTGTSVDVIVDQTEDIGRIGFAGLLAEAESEADTRAAARPVAAESPQSWAPVGVSLGAVADGPRRAVEDFCLWLADRRVEAHS